jgi:hypothetical protein
VHGSQGAGEAIGRVGGLGDGGTDVVGELGWGPVVVVGDAAGDGLSGEPLAKGVQELGQPVGGGGEAACIRGIGSVTGQFDLSQREREISARQNGIPGNRG